MQKIHRFHASRAVPVLVVLAFCIRVLVPQGYMIESSGEGFTGFSVVICDGAAGIVSANLNSSFHLQTEEFSFQGHQNHLPNGSIAFDEQSAHADHIQGHSDCSSCGLWLASSAFVDSVEFDVDDLVYFASDNYLDNYVYVQTRRPSLHSHQSRAPPLASLRYRFV